MAIATLPPLASTPPRKPGLLVIDDEKALLRYLKRVFSTRYEVLTAENALEAETLLREHGEIKVILCDEEMPGEKGLEFLSRTRSRVPRVQRILMTGHTDPETFLRAIHESDVLCYLVKPASPEAIRAAVDRGVAEHEKCESIDSLKAELADAHRRLSTLPRLARNLRAIAGAYGSFLRSALKVTILTAAVAITLGVVTIGFLYVLKSQLGIDIFAERHFSDLLKSIAK
jgi:DNA-binding NtrC family response regulator